MPIGGRTDANQGVIVEALRKAGVSVIVTSHVGQGFPDLCCHHWRVGIKLLEVKGKRKRGNLTPAQEKLIAEFPVVVVTSAREALEAMGLGVE